MNDVTDALYHHRLRGTLRELSSAKSFIDFSSNDYLGLSKCPNIRTQLLAELESGCPLGATGSRLLSGQTIYHERVEGFLSNAFGSSSALLFSSGYMANLGVLYAFGTLNTEFFSDELNHASLVDGMKLSKSPKSIFHHNDLCHLVDLLSRSNATCKVIVTESVFSMDGDSAPLRELLAVAERFDAWLVVDEAHAMGVFGPRGLGRIEEVSVNYSNIVSIHTGGKSLGGQGAFVLSSQEFRDLLINRARSFIFSTALAPLSCLQIEFAMKEVLRLPDRNRTVLKNANSLRNMLSQDFDLLKSQSQIIPIVLGSNERVLVASDRLRSLGFDVRAIRSPTVPKGTERLRLTVKSFHQEEDFQGLERALAQAVAV